MVAYVLMELINDGVDLTGREIGTGFEVDIFLKRGVCAKRIVVGRKYKHIHVAVEPVVEHRYKQVITSIECSYISMGIQ